MTFENTLTQHAKSRVQQRGIPPLALDLLLQFGRCERAGGGALKVYLDKKGRRRLQAYAGPLSALLREYLDIYAIVSEQDEVITVAHRRTRLKHN